MSTLARPSEAAQAPRQPRSRWWLAVLAVVVIGAAVAAVLWFTSNDTPQPPSADPMDAYVASTDNPTARTPTIYTKGPDATFADASNVSITHDGQTVGDLWTLKLVPGALAAINVDPQALMRRAAIDDPTGEVPDSAADFSVIGATLVACTHGWGVAECAWFQDGALKVFQGMNFGGEAGEARAAQFLQDYLGGTRTIPTE